MCKKIFTLKCSKCGAELGWFPQKPPENWTKIECFGFSGECPECKNYSFQDMAVVERKPTLYDITNLVFHIGKILKSGNSFLISLDQFERFLPLLRLDRDAFSLIMNATRAYITSMSIIYDKIKNSEIGDDFDF